LLEKALPGGHMQQGHSAATHSDCLEARHPQPVKKGEHVRGQPSRVDAMVLVGATTNFPEHARAVMRVVASQGAPPVVMEHFRQCAAQGDAQVKELVRQFGGFKDSYDDMNFTAPYLGTIKARTQIVAGDLLRRWFGRSCCIGCSSRELAIGVFVNETHNTDKNVTG